MRHKKISLMIYMTAALFTGAFFLAAPDTVSESVTSSLNFCAARVVPAVFPYSVLSSFFLYTGGAYALERKFHRIFFRIFGIRAGASAFISGLLFGFPLGAMTAGGLCRDGRITPRECARLLCFSCPASPAFPVFVVGGACLRSIRAGVFIWITQAALSFLLGAALNKIKPLETCSTCKDDFSDEPDIGCARAITAAVSDSARVMISVCGSVTFFSLLSAVMTAALQNIINEPDLSSALTLAVRSIFEFTSGAASAGTALAEGCVSFPAAMLACGFTVGFSGLAVICQNASVSPKSVSLSPHIISKLTVGILTGVLSALYAALTDAAYPVFGSEYSAPTPHLRLTSLAAGLGLSVIIIIVYMLIKFVRSRYVTRSAANKAKIK